MSQRPPPPNLPLQHGLQHPHPLDEPARLEVIQRVPGPAAESQEDDGVVGEVGADAGEGVDVRDGMR